MSRQLNKALRQQKKQNKQSNLQIAGSLGIPLGGSKLVEVPNRKPFVYVRLRDNPNEVIQAFNNRVSPAYNLPVLVEFQNGRYIVDSVDSIRYQNSWPSFAPFLPRHGNTHSADFESGGGGDIAFIHPRQFIPALIFPSGSSGAPNAFMYPYLLHNSDGTWKYTGNTGTQNVTPYNPIASGTARMLLVYLDASSGNPVLLVNSGTSFSSTLTGTSQIYPYIPTDSDPNHIPLAAIRLVTGTSVVSWDNIYDVRQFIHIMPTGSGGGGGTITGSPDATYLRLDTTNDPLTDQLDIDATGHPGDGAIYGITEGDAFTADFEQFNSSQDFASSPALYVYREITNSKSSNAAHMYLDEVYTTGIFSGASIRIRINGADYSAYNPHIYATGTVLFFNTINTISTLNGKLLSLMNADVEKFAIRGNGDLYLNDGAYIYSTTGTGIGIARNSTQKLGFFGATPIVQPGTYTPTNVTTDRSYDANSTTVDELADVLGTLITDLKNLGLIG